MTEKQSALADELDRLSVEKKAIEEKIAAIYKRSLDAPPEEKVCEDYIAGMLANPTRFLTFPITVHGITYSDSDLFGFDIGYERFSLVSVRPCEKALKGKTFLGIYIGQLPQGVGISYHRESGVLAARFAYHNPAIWVPELQKIVWGSGSWWSPIESLDALRAITDEEINNTWYVKLLSAQLGEDPCPAT
jgi:hypothetical protein